MSVVRRKRGTSVRAKGVRKKKPQCPLWLNNYSSQEFRTSRKHIRTLSMQHTLRFLRVLYPNITRPLAGLERESNTSRLCGSRVLQRSHASGWRCFEKKTPLYVVNSKASPRILNRESRWGEVVKLKRMERRRVEGKTETVGNEI